MELQSEAESTRAMAKLGESYVQYVIELRQQIADMGKASRAQDKYIKTLKNRRDETINHLNNKIRSLERKLQTVIHGEPRQTVREESFTLGESIRVKEGQRS